MSGLRERKKAETRAQIVAAAESLFAERGLQEPTMEELAEAAAVSVATLYNYFGSKVALQMAVFEAETLQIVEGGRSVIDDPGEDPEGAVRRLVDAQLDGFLRIDRGLLLDVFHTGLASAEILPGLVNLDLLLLQQMRDLMNGLAGRGLISARRVEDSALLVYSSLLTVLLFHLTVDSITPEEARRQVHDLVAAAFRGIGNPES